MGNVMCWLREKASRRLRKGEEDEQLGVSTWMLKSPVMMSYISLNIAKYLVKYRYISPTSSKSSIFNAYVGYKIVLKK